jgi:hypothetical protein
MGNADVRLSAVGFGIRLAVLIAILLIVMLAFVRHRRTRVQD